MKKIRLYAALLAAVLILTGCSVYAAPVFTDVSQDAWYYSTVLKAKDLGLIGGYPDGSFRPSAQVSHAEFLKMAAGNSERLAGGHWASGIFADARSRGLFSAADFSASQLDRPIARKHMALISANLLREAGKLPAGGGAALPIADFSDVDSADRYEYYISVCASAGIIGGYPDGSFRPDKGLTRAEAAAVCVRIKDWLDGGYEAAAGGGAGANGGGAADTIPGDAADTMTGDAADTMTGDAADTMTGDAAGGSVPTAEEMMDPGARELARAVLESVSFDGSAGVYRFSCSQPEIPEPYHLKISLEIFAKNGEGTPTLLRYVSDEGYLADPSRYDASAHVTEKTIQGLGGISGKAVFLEILITNTQTREMASYYLKQDFSGERSLSSVYDPPASEGGLRIINSESAEGYFNWT